MHAGKLFSHRADQQRRNDGGVHAAGQGQQDLLLSDLCAELGQLLINKSLGKLGRGDARHGFGPGVVCHKIILLFLIIILLRRKAARRKTHLFFAFP